MSGHVLVKYAVPHTPVGSLLALYPRPPLSPLPPPLAPPPQVVDMPEHHPGQMGGTMRLGKRKTIFKTKDCMTCKSCSGCGMEDLIVCVQQWPIPALDPALCLLQLMCCTRLVCGCVRLCKCVVIGVCPACYVPP